MEHIINDPRSVHHLRFPHALNGAISMTAALAGHLPEITTVGSTQVALECLADKWNFNRRILPAIYWSFVHVPAHLIAALVISLVAFASMLVGCGECQCKNTYAQLPVQTPQNVALLFPR